MTARAALGAILAAAALVSGCGAPSASPGSAGAVTGPSAPPSAPVSSPPGPSAPVSPPSAPATAPSGPVGLPVSPGPSQPVPSGAQVTRDPALLAILPASVAGVPVTEEPQSFGEAVADPAFVASVDRAAFAIAVSGGDLTSGVVAHLRPGVYSDAMFSDWRSSYDDGACAQAGGVVAHAEEDQGGRTVYVTTCGGGLRVYHTYLASRGVIVSLLTSGPADLGGQLMAAIAG